MDYKEASKLVKKLEGHGKKESRETVGKVARITLSLYHYDKLIDMLKNSDEEELLNAILERKTLISKMNKNKVFAMEKATEIRVAKAKKNIKLAYENLIRNDKKVTQKAISEISKCSVNTVRKYDFLWKK